MKGKMPDIDKISIKVQWLGNFQHFHSSFALGRLLRVTKGVEQDSIVDRR